MGVVKVAIGCCSYRGPDLHCFIEHWRFLHYLGRLQERSYWMNRCQEGNPRCGPGSFGEHSLDLGYDDPEFKFFLCVQVGNSIIGQARDRVARLALESGCDYIFFFDDDMMFPLNSFLRLWRHQVDFVGALAFTAREPITPVLFQFIRTFNVDLRREDIEIKPYFRYPKDSLVRIDALGSGVVLIRTEVFKRLEEPWFHGAISQGEDIHLCYKMGQAGIPVYCDTSIKTLHKPNEPRPWMDELHYLEHLEESEKEYERIVGQSKPDDSDPDIQ